MFNAWQPGVFALSGWDLCGALTLDPAMLGDLVADGDTRWIHRGAYDLMNYRPDGGEQPSALPRAACLYGPLPAQLADPDLVRVAAAAHPSGPREVRDLDRDTTRHRRDLRQGACWRWSTRWKAGGSKPPCSTSRAGLSAADVTSQFLPPGAVVSDVSGSSDLARVDRTHSFTVPMHPHQGRSLVFGT